MDFVSFVTIHVKILYVANLRQSFKTNHFSCCRLSVDCATPSKLLETYGKQICFILFLYLTLLKLN